MAQSTIARFQSLLYRLRFPGARIAPGCFIRRDSVLAPDAELGPGTCIAGGRLFRGVKLGSHNQVEGGAHVGASQFGEYCVVQENARVSNAVLEGNTTIQAGCVLDQVKIGAWSYVARDTILNDVQLGRFCSVGPRTVIGAGEHPIDLVSTSPAFYSTRGQCGPAFATQTSFVERRTIVIGHDVWIGAHVFICDGVTIGNGAIIAAGAVETGDVAAYTLVGGVPAKLIRPRFSAAIAVRLEALAWWNWEKAKLALAQPYIVEKNPEKFLSWAEAQRAP
jgi:acetyltransferase-like isoleucine patch superfamily enzyme